MENDISVSRGSSSFFLVFFHLFLVLFVFGAFYYFHISSIGYRHQTGCIYSAVFTVSIPMYVPGS